MNNSKKSSKQKIYPNEIFKEAFQIPSHYKANCYTFSLGPKIGPYGYSSKRSYKARPGDKCHEWKQKEFNFKSCSEFVKRILCDNPEFVQLEYFNRLSTKNMKRYTGKNYNRKIESGWHLIAAYLADGSNGTDFHFLRRVELKHVLEKWKLFKQNTPASTKRDLYNLISLPNSKQPKYLWIHQRGWSSGGPIIYGADNKLIFHPAEANLNYPHMNYNILCGIFKVKTRYATVTS